MTASGVQLGFPLTMRKMSDCELILTFVLSFQLVECVASSFLAFTSILHVKLVNFLP